MEAYEFYFLLLLLKYKFGDVFRCFLVNKKPITEFGSYIREKLGFELDEESLRKLKLLYDSGKIGRGSFYVRTYDGDEAGGGMQINSIEFKEAEKANIQWLKKTNDITDIHEVIYDDRFCLDFILFFPDLKKWDQIKHLTLAQYYHQQLEMFDFVLPADEAKAEP